MIAEFAAAAGDSSHAFAMKAHVRRVPTLPLIAAFIAVLGCDQEEKGEAPPAETETPPGICVGIAGPIAGLPGKVGELCVDPRSDVRRYGVAASSPLDAVCVELFNGECELYKSYGLEGVKTLRYVGDRRGGAGRRGRNPLR